MEGAMMNVKLASMLSGAGVILALAPAAASAVNLITNGDFESWSGSFLPSAGYSTVNAGQSFINDWTVGSTSVDVIRGAYGAISGISIDLLGTPGPGSVSQTFASSASQQYKVAFDLSKNTYSTGGASAMTVIIGGAAPLSLSYTGTASPTHYEFLYTATGTSTNLKFVSADSGNSGAVLDNVSVTAVPEADTYTMLIAGLGLVGFVARRRMPKSL